MRRLSITLLAVLCTISFYAENLLTEDFKFDGKLTDNGWYTTYGGELSFTTTSGLEFDNYAGCNVGNACVLDAKESEQAHKGFNAVSSGNVYVAFMLQPTIIGEDGYFFCLRDEVSTSTFNFNARVWINTSMQLGLTFADNTKKEFNTKKTLEQNRTYLVVLKYSIKAGERNDEVSMYVLDSYSATEPDTPFIGPLKDAEKNDINPQNVVLRGYDNNSWIVVDGIRVGTTWADAVQKGTCNTELEKVTTEEKLPYAENGVVHFATKSGNVRMMDASGKVIIDKRFENGSHTLNIEKGVYLLSIDGKTYKLISK